MKTLSEVLRQLQTLEDAGHGNRKMFATHGASGARNPVGSAYVTNNVGETSPFDLEDGEWYISLYIGY